MPGQTYCVLVIHDAGDANCYLHTLGSLFVCSNLFRTLIRNLSIVVLRDCEVDGGRIFSNDNK